MKSGAGTRVLKLAEKVEAMPITLGRWLLILGAIIVLRHFLEQLSGQQKTLYFLSYFLHYPLAYIAPLIALAIVLSAFSRERIERVTRLMLFAWLLTLLPPLIDILRAHSTESPELIGYLIPRSGTLSGAFFNLLNPGYHQFQGATAGIRIEAGLGCLLGAYYVHLKTRSLLRSLLAFATIYVTMFFFFTLPVIVLAVSRVMGGDAANVYQLFFARASVHRAFANATPFALSDMSNALVDLLVLAPLLIVWYRMYDRARFGVLRRLFDVPVVTFHLLSTLAGLLLGARLLMGSRGLQAIAHPFDVISIVGILASSLFVAVAASALRELHEPAPGPSEAERERLLTLGLFAFSFASLLALSVSYVAVTYVLSMMAVYYFYYVRPLRLARFTPLSGLAIGAVALFSVTLGFAAYAGGSASLWLPKPAVAACLLVPLFGFLARDIWASRTESVRWDLAAVLGPKRARFVAAGGLIVAGLLPALLLRQPTLLIPGAAAGIAGAFAVVALRPSRIPGTLTLVGAAALLVGLGMGAASAPALSAGLNTTDFSRVTRRSGEFEMFDREGATEEQRLLADGIDLFRRGDYEGSIEAFRQVTEMDPENTQAFVSVGSAYMRMNRLSEAGRAFRRALSLEPDNAQAHVGLAQVDKLAGDPDAALAELDLAVEADPQNADAYYTRAIIYGELGDLQKEMDALTKTVSIDPRNSMAQSRLADIYLANEMFPEAISALKAALTGRTPVDHLHTRMADAYYSLGELDSAENELRKEIALRPQLASPHANLARLLSDMGRIDEARHEYETAISLTGDERLKGFLQQELSGLGS
jgi:tetratricopeptide (TPR) repeat protein